MQKFGFVSGKRDLPRDHRLTPGKKNAIIYTPQHD